MASRRRLLSLQCDPANLPKDPNFDLFLEVTSGLSINPFSDRNAEGIVDLGVAVNALAHGMMKEKIKSIQEKMDITTDLLDYSPSQPSRVVNALIGYLDFVLQLKRPLSSDQVFIGIGVHGALGCLLRLICDPGDGVLLATPCYGPFQLDCDYRTKTKLVFVDKAMGDDQPATFESFKPTVEDYETAYDKATKEGINVRALLVTNPHNPIGYILSRDELLQLVQFAHRHSIHLIVDEIYMKSVINPEAKFTSVLELTDEELPDPEFVHCTWGFSKDFGLPGLKTGFVISCGRSLASAYFKNCMFVYSSGSKIDQEILTSLLNDKEWLSKVYFPTKLELSQKALKMMTDCFDEIGVPYIRPDAGLFVYTDLRKFTSKLSRDPKEGEIILLKRFITEGKVYVGSGSTLCKSLDSGWFRPVFSCQLDVLREGLERVKTVLKAIDGEK